MTNTNINFNVTTGKVFRDTIAKYHTAGHNLKDVLAKFKKELKDAQSSKAQLEETSKSENALISKEDCEKAIKVQDALIEKIKSEIEKARKKAVSREETGLALVTDDLYDAYVDANSWDKLSECDAENDVKYLSALCDWFKGQGFQDATPENVKVFAKMVSQKRSGARNIEYFRTAESRKQFNKDFIEGICDYLQVRGLIAPHKYEYIVKKSKKDGEKA